MAYPNHYYQEMRRIQNIIADANAHGRCPICRKPQGVWPDGVRRITCGSDACTRKWLPGRYIPEPREDDETA